ncbi:MAG: hypothetical protein SGILL_010872 [Bacillariaceae sp.]
MSATEAFVLPKFSSSNNAQSLSMAKKGFGNTQPSTPPKKKNAPLPTPQTYDEANAVTAAAENQPPVPVTASTTTTNTASSPPDTSQGKAALERMIQERADARNAELQAIQQVQQIDDMVKDAPAAIPEKVAQRMGKRMLPFVGIPLFGSMASFIGFWYMATYRDMEFQPVLVATTSLVLLAVGIVGITYSIMSASWDDDREGSMLGTDEFAQNVDNIKTGLSRSRENAILREKMQSGMYSQADLEKFEKEQSKKEKPASFSQKMEDEMD